MSRYGCSDNQQESDTRGEQLVRPASRTRSSRRLRSHAATRIAAGAAIANSRMLTASTPIASDAIEVNRPPFPEATGRRAADRATPTRGLAHRS